MTKNGPQQELQKVVPEDGTTALVKPDPLLEELNVVRIEGRYFCFDKHEAKKKKGVYEYRDGNRVMVVVVNPLYGQPSTVAYKVLQAVFRKITLEGKPYPDTVAFSYRELAAMIGRDIIGGQDSRQLLMAIRQLRNTEIRLYLIDPKTEKKTHQFGSLEFSLITTAGFVGEGAINSPRLKAAVLTVNPRIMDSMREGHFVIFNWARIGKLEPVAAAMYKRLYLHLSNLYENQYSKDALAFEKRYEDICAEWLGGLKPERYKSRIQKQLGEHLKSLSESGLIRSVAIERTADGQSFKMVFKPGKSFFHDYDHFYRKDGKNRLLQFQDAADKAHLKTPYMAVRLFYKGVLKADEAKLDEMIFPERDIAVVRPLIDQFGEEAVLDLIQFAIEQAPKTNFQMQTIAAVKQYLPAWQAERDKRAKRLVIQRQEQEERRLEKLKADYEAFTHKAVIEYVEKCSPAETEEIHRLAEAKLGDKVPPHDRMRKVMLKVAERTLILERCKVPSFEKWLANHS